MFAKLFAKKTEDKKVDQTTPYSELEARYNLIRSLAQDAADATEKWAQTQFSSTGKRPMSNDKKLRACSYLAMSLQTSGIDNISIDMIDFMVEAAVGAQMVNELPSPDSTVSDILDLDKDDDD